jgi:predicted CXXCH cytochrome family protein
MKKKYFTPIVGCTFILLLTNFFWGSIAAQEEGPEIYQQEVKPLTSLECARCHYNVFTEIRDRGGAHQLACKKCHETFHTYKPGMEWKDAVPDCNTCHDKFHGEELPDCLRCHQNAHSPTESLNVEKMSQDCHKCHEEPAADLKKFFSAHAEMSCNECHHDKHRYMPTCIECHEEPHAPYVDDAGCIACHPAHSPLEINYPESLANDVCISCHKLAEEQLSQNGKKHAFLQCTFCHAEKHRYVPSCQHCHGKGPHTEEMLKKFESCQDCHGTAHLLMIKAHELP